MQRNRGFGRLLATVMLGAVVLWGGDAGLRAQGGLQKWALVVGVDRYEQTAKIDPLHYAGADAMLVAKTLRECGGFPARNVFVMTTSGGEPPTSRAVMQKLVGLRDVVQPGDTFVFFFSGHGAEKGDERWLLTSDTDPASLELMRLSTLSVRAVHEAMKSLRASRILQVIDACANDPWREPGKDPTAKGMSDGMSRDLVLSATREGGDLEAAVTLVSCKVGQRSYESRLRKQGYFTWFLVEGMRGAAARDGA